MPEMKFLDGSGITNKGVQYNAPNTPINQALQPNTPQSVVKPSNLPTVQSPQVIDSSMFNATPLNVPTQPISNQAPITSSYQNTIDNLLQTQDTPNQKLATDLSTKVYDLLPKLAGQDQELANQQQLAGVNDYKKQLNDINAQIYQKQAELAQDDVRLVAGLQQIEDKPVAMEFITGQQASLQRQAQIARALKASEVGVLNARVQALNGSLSLAMETATQAVNAKYAPYKEAISIYQQQLQALDPILRREDAKQARTLELKTQFALKDIEKREAEEKSKQTLALQASQYGAPQNVVKAIGESKTMLEAINAAGKYTSDPLEKTLKLAQINASRASAASSYANVAESRAKIAQIANEIKQTGIQLASPTANGSTTDTVQKLLNSALGKGQLDASERASITKARNVVDQLGSLQSTIEGLNKKGDIGPIKGKWTQFITALGKNPEAGLVNAQLKALVPQLSRGIFGEVGVLTDSDIANYTKTLPNLTSTQQQNDLVMAMTLKTVQNSIKNTLTTAADSGINVSKFAGDYKTITDQIKSIENRIGVTKAKVDNFYSSNPDKRAMIKEMYQNGYKSSEIIDALGISN